MAKAGFFGHFAIFATPFSELIAYLVAPEALELNGDLIEMFEIGNGYAANLFEHCELPLQEAVNHLGDRLALVRQLDTDGALVRAGALVMDVAAFNKFLQIVGNVRAEIEAAGFEFTGGQLHIADIEQQKGLDAIDVRAADAFELVLDEVEKKPVQSFDHAEGYEVIRFETLVFGLNTDEIGDHGTEYPLGCAYIHIRNLRGNDEYSFNCRKVWKEMTQTNEVNKLLKSKHQPGRFFKKDIKTCRAIS
jgi:hypothetical protein